MTRLSLIPNSLPMRVGRVCPAIHPSPLGGGGRRRRPGVDVRLACYRFRDSLFFRSLKTPTAVEISIRIGDISHW